MDFIKNIEPDDYIHWTAPEGKESNAGWNKKLLNF